MVALQAFQASLLELRTAGLQTEDALGLQRIYVNGAVTHLLRGSLVAADWCDLWDYHVERCFAQLLLVTVHCVVSTNNVNFNPISFAFRIGSTAQF